MGSEPALSELVRGSRPRRAHAVFQACPYAGLGDCPRMSREHWRRHSAAASGTRDGMDWPTAHAGRGRSDAGVRGWGRRKLARCVEERPDGQGSGPRASMTSLGAWPIRQRPLQDAEWLEKRWPDAPRDSFRQRRIMATSPTGSARLTVVQLKKLREPFAPGDVKQRKGSGGKMLDYVAIETVLGRLIEVAPEFNWVSEVVNFWPRVYLDDGDERVTYAVVVQGQLHIGEKTATGVGAMINPDPDMAVKTANSEAMKNAAKNGFGVALELWDEEYRKGLDRRRKLAKGSAAALKQEVFKMAVERTGKAKPSAKEVAALFDVEPGDLADEDTLHEILKKEGLL